MIKQDKPKVVFISHSTRDKEYVTAFVELLESLGLRENEIVCSSIPPYCVPLDRGVYEWLVDKFRNCELYVIYMLSHNYYRSVASLNEMGAAWAMKQKWSAILLPNFSFREIKGCIDSNQIGIKLDDADVETLKFRLGELKDALVGEFHLGEMSASIWERKRDGFLNAIARIKASQDNPNEKEQVSDVFLRKNMDTAVNNKEEVFSNSCTVLKKTDNIKIKLEACHYTFLRFLAPKAIYGTELENKYVIKKLDGNMVPGEFELPMLRCEVTNCSSIKRTVQEPIIEGNIEMKNQIVDAMGFFSRPEFEKELEPGAKVSFIIDGPTIIYIIRALFDHKIEEIYVEDNFGFSYSVIQQQIDEITDYYKKYCSDLEAVQLKHDKYWITTSI